MRRMLSRCAVLALVLCAAGAAWAAWSTFGKPRPPARYAWLAFGTAPAVKVLMRHQGGSVAFDLDGDGQFRGESEIYSDMNAVRGIAIPVTGGEGSYVIERVSSYAGDEGDRLLVHVLVGSGEPYQQYCDVGGSAAPEGAPCARFDAPLVVALQRGLEVAAAPPTLHRGSGSELRVNVATVDRATGCWVVVRSDAMHKPGTSAFPAGVHPYADVEFPPRRAGGPPVRQRYALDKTCCGSLFRGVVKVPDEAGAGTAKLTISFDAWERGKVEGSTVEVPVAPPRQVADAE